MSDFSTAFRQGQSAAESAAEANAEIDEIFKGMADELRQITNGKLVLSVEKALAFKIISFLVGNDPSSNPSEDLWICARNPISANSNMVRIARFERPYEGYPCTIQYGKTDVRCNDGIALAGALKDMLTNAWVAHELREVVNRPPKQEPNAEGQCPSTE